MTYHYPVMLQESLKGLSINPHGIYIDVTFGGGGHSLEILKYLDTGRLIAFDQDQDAIKIANNLHNKRFTFIQANFATIHQFLAMYHITEVDGIIADLGVSSHQLKTTERGFSFQLDAPLDMRMNQKSTNNAQKIINTYTIQQLTTLLWTYGEVQNAHKVARAIAAQRSIKSIKTTFDLVKVLQKFAPKNKEFKYYAKIFQSFRIETNNELNALKKLLMYSSNLLKKNGRLVVLSYHSLEDRLVKKFISTGNFEGMIQKDLYGNLLRPLHAVYKKVITPTLAEMQNNPSSRSAKLRIAKKI